MRYRLLNVTNNVTERLIGWEMLLAAATRAADWERLNARFFTYGDDDHVVAVISVIIKERGVRLPCQGASIEFLRTKVREVLRSINDRIKAN